MLSRFESRKMFFGHAKLAFFFVLLVSSSSANETLERPIGGILIITLMFCLLKPQKHINIMLI